MNPQLPIRRTTLKRHPFATKLKAVELFTAGVSPDTIASELSLNSKMSVYAWAQRFREEGKWGLMSATALSDPRRQHPTQNQCTLKPEEPVYWGEHQVISGPGHLLHTRAFGGMRGVQKAV
ncbi:hypothetical protein NUI01_07115 [Corynebacterium sp. MC-17D]|nr:hypothetical protein [Corynebacterium lipophilum]MCZ2117456.1 hypothetical protein [Corynebacterium lipophilum]